MHVAIVSILATCAVMLWLGCVYAMFRAAANRKPGIGYFSALNGISLLFRNSLYTSDGLRWSTTYTKCAIGFVLIVAVLAVLSWFK
jgi:hypothetical protein